MFTGAIVQSNSINMFVETAKKLKIKDIQIVLVGQGQERVKYEQIAKDESLSNISFLDPVDKKLVPKLLDYADVLLLIQGNVQWGSSNKLYDYLAARKPIITSLYVKHNDVVEDIGCGYSSGYDNSDDMVKNIEKIYKLSDEEKEQMGEKAYSYVSQNHDIKLMAKKLEKLCKELVSNV
jgi:glycosyltransferase involved in cell wall biosynthesis